MHQHRAPSASSKQPSARPLRRCTRRDVLRGAGALIALPFLESIAAGEPGSPAAVRPPLRLGIITVAGGTVVESWKLKQPGPLTKLPSILRPLEAFKSELLVLTGLGHGGKGEGVNGHEHAAFLHLTGAAVVKKVNGRAVAGPSVDQVAAAAVGERTVLPSLELGVTNNETRFSFRAADQHVPCLDDPRQVFERMFRNGRRVAVPNWARRATRAAAAPKRGGGDEQSVIDLVLADANRLRGRSSADDRQRLDEYLNAVRSLERRIQVAEGRLNEESLDTDHPGPSKPVRSEVPDAAACKRMRRLLERDPEAQAEYTRLMSDLLVLAFQTDTTRVATLAQGSDETMYHGVVTVGYERHYHTLEHQGNANPIESADPIAREACRQVHTWHTGLFAEVVRKLAAIDEGGSRLLDNCLLLYTSYMADGGHGRDDYPVLLVGNAQGTLRPGRQIDFPRHTPMSNLYVELLDRMGAPSAGFGDSATAKHAAFDGHLPGLR